jgi:magnesium-protoporphyrin O-methyltransferase
MSDLTYATRRSELQTYFDRTAADAWAKLTSTAPVGRIRATVRAGRNDMRDTLLRWLPEDLRGKRVLDAGCGTGAFAVEAARRGAEVVAIDIAQTLVDLAQERAPRDLGEGRIEFRVGDMLDPTLGQFDHVVAMDSLIHYRAPDLLRMMQGLTARSRGTVAFTFAPQTPAFAILHAVGRLFPRSDRAPAIEPISESKVGWLVDQAIPGWTPHRTKRITSGFYKSQALELVPVSA